MMRQALLLLALAMSSMSGGAFGTATQPDETAGASEDGLRRAAEEDPNDPVAQYNLGTVLLLRGAYDEARPHLEFAARLLHATQRDAASYNLGATDLEPAYVDEDLPEREVRLRRAIEAYKQALLAEPSDMDAKWNLELARRLLERDQQSSSGGGGGGAGGEGQPMPGTGDPSPSPAASDGPQPRMTDAEAESLLQSAREQELGVQQDRLRKPQPPGPIRP